MSRLEKGHAGIMVDRLGVHRFDEAQIVGHRGSMRQEVADPGPPLTVLPKFPVRTRDGKRVLPRRHSGESLCLPDESLVTPGLRLIVVGLEQFLTVMPVHQGFVVEQIQLRGRTVHEQKYHTLGTGRPHAARFGDAGDQGFRRQHGLKGHGPNPRTSVTQQLTACDHVFQEFGDFVHVSGHRCLT